MEPLLRAALEGPCRVPRGARILIAASGGADSTALLIGLARLAHERALSLHVAHLHHGLRGAAADADRAEVEGLCARLGLRRTSARWDTRARMRRRGLSGQRGLRVLRREFLSTVARRVAADR
ncbi:MAG: tRNA(Ile)-lysidine synthetase, partial [Candidatus Eisenbacteria bacterium]|nr:tRNA(Ile)-lysidine synthetase [Candidatus Eisenbacteria bacterium]